MNKKSNSDKRWEWFNKDLEECIKSGDFYQLGATYYEMADFLKKEGRNDNQLRELGYKMKLKFQIEKLNEYKKSDIATGIEIIAYTNGVTNNCCDACKQLNGKIFPINEALLKNPLPVKNCNYICGCRCVYGPVCD